VALDRITVEAWFPDTDLLVVPEAVLPPGLTDPGARAILRDIGIPESVLDVVETHVRIVERIITIEDELASHGGHAPPGAADLYYLGFVGDPMLAIDGATGALTEVDLGFGTRPLAGSLETFLRVLGPLNQLIDEYQDEADFDADRFAAQLRNRALPELERLEATVSPAQIDSWDQLLGDLAANAEWD
jgi:SUKH-4 immunity protein